MIKSDTAEKTNMRSGLFFLLLALSLPALVGADGGDSGGGRGGSVFVGKVKGKTVARMADLLEAEIAPFNWPHSSKDGTIRIKRTNKVPAEAQFSDAIKRLALVDREFAEAVAEAKESIFAKRNPVKPGVEIQPDDSGTVYSPNGMKLKGMMYVNPDTGMLDVREELFSILETQTDIAAAWLHEAIYKVLRGTTGTLTSKTTRRLVGCLFADGQDRACLATNTYPIRKSALSYECNIDHQRFTLVPSNASPAKAENNYFRNLTDVPYASHMAVKHETANPDGTIRERAYGVERSANGFRLITPKAGDRITRTEPNVDPLRIYGYGDQMDIGISFDPKGNASLELRRLSLGYNELYPPGKRTVKCRTVLPTGRSESAPTPEPPEDADDGPPSSLDGR